MQFITTFWAWLAFILLPARSWDAYVIIFATVGQYRGVAGLTAASFWATARATLLSGGAAGGAEASSLFSLGRESAKVFGSIPANACNGDGPDGSACAM